VGERVGSLAGVPDLDRWVGLLPGDRVVVRTGKVELGQGIRTALVAVAADELGVDPARIEVGPVTTGTSPNEWITAGSGSIEQSAVALRHACAHGRRVLLERAAERLGTAALTLDDGTVRTADGRSVTYWELLPEGRFGVAAEGVAQPVPAGERRWAGRGLPRIDLPAKARGEPVFVHDLVLPGMRHARVLRPPRPGARLAGPLPRRVGRADVVVHGSFVAVVADRVADAVTAVEALERQAAWRGGDEPVGTPLREAVTHRVAIVDGAGSEDPPGPELDHGGAARVVRATYRKPFLLHGSIGPSATVAWYDDGRLSVWCHSQGVEVLRPALAEVLRLDADVVTVHHVDGAGCYGHNGADDVALDAALVAVADPGRPVSLVWRREDEHRWEPAAPAMEVDVAAGLDTSGRITSWQQDVFSYSHLGRPWARGDGTSGLLAAWYLDSPRPAPPRRPSRGFHSGGHRNADPLYDVGARRIVKHVATECPVRTSATRALGAFANVFAIESFVDELVLAAGSDPVAFRLAHLRDERAREVVEAAVDAAGGLTAPGGIDAPGRGIAFARYENIKAYVAVVVEASVVARTGEVRLRRAWIAADAGEVIDPDGLRNQLEGGFVQAASWTLKEELAPDRTAADWEAYPILRFSEVPEVDTVLLDRPDQPPLGAGEAATGPTAAAIANAVTQATGARIRDLPLRPDRVRAALAELL
jgi:nicotinate dehydrogenase subunit B